MWNDIQNYILVNLLWYGLSAALHHGMCWLKCHLLSQYFPRVIYNFGLIVICSFITYRFQMPVWAMIRADLGTCAGFINFNFVIVIFTQTMRYMATTEEIGLCKTVIDLLVDPISIIAKNIARTYATQWYIAPLEFNIREICKSTKKSLWGNCIWKCHL